MAGSWDFTLTSTSFNGDSDALEAILAQDTSGNISASGPATANGPSGNVFLIFLIGADPSSATNMGVDFMGAACGGNDDGSRNMTGTINSSNQVTLTLARGGAQTITITGTLTASATPPFSGTFTISAPGCGSDGDTGNVTGSMAGTFAGNYAGTPYNNNTDNITFSLTTGTNDSFTGSGNDSQSGPFTLSGTTVGNAAYVTNTAGGQNTSLLSYYDPQLGTKGSIFSSLFAGGNATSCPNGAPLPGAGAGCLYAIFAQQ